MATTKVTQNPKKLKSVNLSGDRQEMTLLSFKSLNFPDLEDCYFMSLLKGSGLICKSLLPSVRAVTKKILSYELEENPPIIVDSELSLIGNFIIVLDSRRLKILLDLEIAIASTEECLKFLLHLKEAPQTINLASTRALTNKQMHL